MFEGLFQPMHLLIIFAIALLVFGPKKLPELGKGLLGRNWGDRHGAGRCCRRGSHYGHHGGAVAGGRGQVCGVARRREAAELIGGRAAGGRIFGKCRVLARHVMHYLGSQGFQPPSVGPRPLGALARPASQRGLSKALRRQDGPASPGAARAACSRGPVTAPEQISGCRRTSHQLSQSSRRPLERARGLTAFLQRIPAV